MNLTSGEGHTENIATLLTKYYFGHSFPHRHRFKMRHFVL